MKEKPSEIKAIEELRNLLSKRFRVETLQDKKKQVLVLTRGWEEKDYLTTEGEVVEEVGGQYFKAAWPVVKEESIELDGQRILLGVIDFKAGSNSYAFKEEQWVLVRPEQAMSGSSELLQIDEIQWYGRINDDAVSPSYPSRIETKNLLGQNGRSLGLENNVVPERIAFVVAVF